VRDHYNERQVWQCDRCGTCENTDYGEVILAEYRHIKGREMCGTMKLVATDRRSQCEPEVKP
jgi:hypothetical protein